ncbi:MAG: RNA polymerase factor sigma-54 [Bacteroidia bacterium]|nr:RNA polymerase factor sigma-54 [Bacteroidia bacterium]
MLKQGLQQKLLQKLSPQQIQFIKLLQIPTASLEARIQEELEDNPALQDADNPEAAFDETTTPDADDEADPLESLDTADEIETDSSASEISLDDYLDREDYSYKTQLQDDPNDERYEAPIVQLNSLYDSLEAQMHLVELNGQEEIVARYIIGNIDEDGYFRRPISSIVDDLAFRQNTVVPEELVENVLHKVQQLDPPGVGARDLQECLLLQLDRKPRSPEVELAQQVLMDYFEEFTKKHFDRIIDRTGVTREQFREAYQLITKLNPKPGESETVVKNQYIIPDFILTVQGTEIDIKLNRRNAPQLNVNKQYLNMLRRLDSGNGKSHDRETKETLLFVKTKIDSARWFIDAIKQRQLTLLKTMSCIAEKQREFFLSEGDPARLRPMILKDVADVIGMDISTVSRVANSKYVQTDFGIFLLKYFFSEGIATDSGDEVSNKEVKKILEDLVGGENKKKPLSDDRLAQLLNDRGYNIARRTVAKYREQLNIPVARLRKEV